MYFKHDDTKKFHKTRSYINVTKDVTKFDVTKQLYKKILQKMLQNCTLQHNYTNNVTKFGVTRQCNKTMLQNNCDVINQ